MLDVRALYTELATDDGVVRAVEALDLTLARGETFALVGESGCGKSVTALSLARLLPENGRITGGSVELALDGRTVDLVQLPEARMRDVRGHRIGMIFQEPATSLNPVMPVGAQIVEVLRRHAGLRGAAARQRAVEWLARVGLPEPARRVDDYPFQLSGGQKQRVMIAMALAAGPDLLIADEPTTALDVTIQQQILDLLHELQREQGMALLLITHDLGIVAKMAHRVALMYAGQIVEVAEAQAFFSRPRHPYAQLLFEALPGTAQRGQPLAAIAGTVPRLDRAFAGCRFAERCPQVMDRCRSTLPALRAIAAGEASPHAVRCLLFDPDRLSAGRVGDAGSRTAAALDAAPAAPQVAVPAAVQVTASPAVVTAADTAPAPVPAAVPGALAPLLSLHDYRVWFPIRSGVLRRTVGYVKAVDGISLALAPGRTLALVGESGCGKSTTGRALLQLLRGTARVQGEARLGGSDLGRLAGPALQAARRRLQIIFQDPYASLNPRMRVGEILAEGMGTLRPDLDATARTARVRRLVDQVGLRPDALARFPHEFSGGQRQRIAIARALAVEPEVIICDEPTSALDVSVQAQILNLLRELQRELGVAYLFITHNFGVVEYLADDIAVMQRGLIVEAGPATDVLTAPRVAYTQALLAAVPRVHAPT
jgi:peptide/nickel transport system ATP-binding protein